MTSIAQPSSDEYAPFYAGYVAQATGGDIVARLGRQIDELETLLAPLDDAGASTATPPASGASKKSSATSPTASASSPTGCCAIGRGDTTRSRVLKKTAMSRGRLRRPPAASPA
ncbi:MAG: hypothetical protein HC897_15775, partial [Thermoanaerobaculia bacterium]|nr:hypothetical protein [Thermoanaerobaculia bacterium]